jgi:hypothetical protein
VATTWPSIPPCCARSSRRCVKPTSTSTGPARATDERFLVQFEHLPHARDDPLLGTRPRERQLLSLKRCLSADPDSKTCAKPLKALKALEKDLARDPDEEMLGQGGGQGGRAREVADRGIKVVREEGATLPQHLLVRIALLSAFFTPPPHDRPEISADALLSLKRALGAEESQLE